MISESLIISKAILEYVAEAKEQKREVRNYQEVAASLRSQLIVKNNRQLALKQDFEKKQEINQLEIAELTTQIDIFRQYFQIPQQNKFTQVDFTSGRT